MKYFGKFILALSFFFLIASPAMAVGQQTATPGAGVNLKKTTGEEVREAAKEKLQERVATIEARLGARKKEIIRNHFERVTRRLEAAIGRINRLIGRIESRLAKIEANNQNLNVTNIKKDITKAKEKTGLATDKLSEVKSQMEIIIESNNPKEGFVQVKTLIDEVRKNLVEAHRLLVKIIGDIKGLRVGNTATPSAETE